MNINALRRCLVVGLLVMTTCVCATGQRVALSMQVAALPTGAADAGALPGSQPMRVTVYLTPTADRVAALQGFLKDVQTPGGAAYHAWLTPAEFGAQFGATAAQVAQVSSFAQGAGLSVESVSASGLRVSLSGTVAQVEAAFAPGLHSVKAGAKVYFANTAVPTMPAALTADVMAVGGLSTVPSAHPLALASEQGSWTAKDALSAVSDAVEGNATRLLSLSTTSCLEDVDAASQSAMQAALRQASAQGITVLAEAGCGGLGSAGFPSALSEVTAVAIAPGITVPASATLTELRPWWQQMAGLPSDGFRHEPDVTVSELAALAQTMETILAKEPVAADGSAARLGNINATLYELAPMAGLYTQPDGATQTWEAATGLGLVDLEKLGKFFPHGALSDNVSISLLSGYVPHGTAATFSSTVTDTSGQGNGVVPTGTVTFTTSSGVALGSTSLSAGTGSVNYSKLPGGTYSVSSAYSGDGTYATNTSISTGFTIAGEASQISATATPVPVGQLVTVTVTDKSGSGVGTPSGTVTVAPQGTSDTKTYTGTLSGTNGTATASVTLPAIQAGNVVLLVNCVSADASFTCYNPVQISAAESQGTATIKLAVTPNPPVTGTTTNFTATVSAPGAAYPAPTGNVVFSDNGASIGSGTIANGVATFSSGSLTSATSHSFTALYEGDNNYTSVSAAAGATTAATATTTTLTVSPNPPVNGSTTTLTATIGYTLTNGVAPTGSVSFFEDNATIGTGTVSGGVATFTSTTLSSSIAHSFFAVYTADANYLTSTSAAVATASTGTVTTTTLTVSPNPPVGGSTTTLTGTIGYVANGLTPTGTMSFYEDGVLLSAVTVTSLAPTFTSSTLTSTVGHSFSAVYSGDTNFKTSTSAAVVTAASGGTVTTTTTMTVSPNPPVSGSTTTLSAAIAYTGTTTVPTGSVSFYEDGVLLSTVAVTSGAASFSSTTLSSTVAHSFYALYSGDTTFKTSTSATVATAASAATTATTTTLTVSPNPPVSGSTTTLTAAVAFTGTSTSTPTGSVSFYEDGTLLYTVPVTSSAASVSSTTLSSTVAHSFSAIYSGDTNFKTSTSAAVATSASTATAATTSTMTVSPNPPVSGSTTTLAATIGYTASGTTTPTGTVGFYEDGVLLASGAVSAGAASVTSTALTSKVAHSFYAVYSGDANFKTSTSAAVATAASTSTATTTTVVTAATSSVATGGSDLLTATITPSSVVNSTAPTGTISFSSATQGVLCAAVTISANVATCAATLTTVGTQSISATYSGDANYTGSTSAAAAVTVGPTAAMTLIVTPSTNVMYGSSVVLSTNVAATTTGGDPAGTITYTLVGTSTVAYTANLTGTSTTGASASVTIPAPIPGTYVVTATCLGTNFTCTTLSQTASLVTIKGNTITTVTASPSAPQAGQTTVLTATVAPALTANGAALAPTGTVTFYINGVATVEALTNGVATFSTVLTATNGSYVTAVYSGDTNWNTSTSSQLIVLIAPAVTTSTVTANETTALYTANVVLSDTVLVPATTLTPNPAAPTGTVTFYDLFNGQTVLLGTASLTQIVPGDSIAQFSTTGLLKGTHNITALFGASTAYASSTSTIVINITDYGYTFAPATMNLSRGSGGAAIATVTAYNGFSGQVVLGCTPPAGSLMTCSFNPAVISVSGTTVLSVTTAAATAYSKQPGLLGGRGTGISLAAVSLGTLLLGLLLPGKRRRLVLPMIAGMVLLMSFGCTSQGTTVTGTTTATGGTPQGAQLLTITTSGTDGLTTVRHNTQYQVTVQ